MMRIRNIPSTRQPGCPAKAHRPPDGLQRACFWALAALGLCGLWASPAAAQKSWEFSPYEIQVWLVVDPATALTDTAQQQLATALRHRAESQMPSVWALQVDPAPAAVAADMMVDLQLVTRERIEQTAENVLQRDKLMLVYVGATPRAYQVRAREMDCRTRSLGPIVARTVRQDDKLADECFSALVESFAAMVRIEQGEGAHLTVRLRAGGLILDPDSPAAMGKGDILQPIVRRNDRVGKPTSIGIVDWTFLEVVGHHSTNPNLLEVYVHSGWRSPIRGRAGSRREQYGLAIRRTRSTTQLRVEGKPQRRDDVPVPLPGLEIYAKRPTTEPAPQSPEERQAAEERNPPILLGLTDWRGTIEIPQSDLPLRLVYIKNGGQLLARLPIVPGAEASLVASVPDDDPRLQAEGYIKGYNGELMDLVAQRQILAALIRKRLGDGRLDEAEKLMERFQELPGRMDMVRQLDQQQRLQRVSPNRMVQQRIENLYADTRKALGRYLDPNLGDQLLRELNQARQGGE